MGLGSYYKPYLALSLYPFCCRHSAVCAQVLCYRFSGSFSTRRVCGVFLLLPKARRGKIDRGYRIETCNSSSLDKSISDTNSITGSYTFFPRDFLCFTLCVSASMCGEETGWGGWWGSPFDGRGGLTEQDWTIFIYNRAEENRFVPDDIFIDWNMYGPPAPLPPLTHTYRAKSDYLGTCGGAFCSQEVKLPCPRVTSDSRWILCFSPTWISHPPTPGRSEKTKEGRKMGSEDQKFTQNVTCLFFFPHKRPMRRDRNAKIEIFCIIRWL